MNSAADTSKHEGTNATMPRHFWMHDVQVLAAKKVGAEATEAVVASNKERLVLWYNSGEPVWMAVDGVCIMVRARTIEERAQAGVDGLRRAVKAGLKAGRNQ